MSIALFRERAHEGSWGLTGHPTTYPTGPQTGRMNQLGHLGQMSTTSHVGQTGHPGRARTPLQHMVQAASFIEPTPLSLTRREADIVRLVAADLCNKQIADHLQISEWTVGTHMRRIFAKLGVRSRAAMVFRAMSLSEGLLG